MVPPTISNILNKTDRNIPSAVSYKQRPQTNEPRKRKKKKKGEPTNKIKADKKTKQSVR